MIGSPAEPLPRPWSWLRGLRFAALLWGSAVFVDFAKDSLAAWLLDQPIGWHLLRASALWWPLLIPLTPLAFALARRVPLTRARWATSLATHIPAATLFALTHQLLARVVVLWRIDHLTSDMLSRQFRGAFAQFFFFDVMVYIALIAGFWARDYAARYRDRAVAAAELERLATAARFEALRWQLNPHFLFNSLNAVAGLVRSGNPNGAVEMLSRLSALLRSTLDEASASDVPLAKELELVHLYAAVERVRFGDRLTVDMRIDDAVLDASVPTLILQPLVENAVRHGVSSPAEAVRVDIEAARCPEGVRISVRDSGGGFSGAADELREGVGLSNARARLGHRFGDSARLDLLNRKEGGAEVVLHLPYQPVGGGPECVR